MNPEGVLGHREEEAPAKPALRKLKQVRLFVRSQPGLLTDSLSLNNQNCLCKTLRWSREREPVPPRPREPCGEAMGACLEEGTGTRLLLVSSPV